MDGKCLGGAITLHTPDNTVARICCIHGSLGLLGSYLQLIPSELFYASATFSNTL